MASVVQLEGVPVVWAIVVVAVIAAVVQSTVAVFAVLAVQDLGMQAVIQVDKVCWLHLELNMPAQGYHNHTYSSIKQYRYSQIKCVFAYIFFE